jgi:hypothetical protein
MYEQDLDAWLSFYGGALYIQERLGVSQAEAQATLRRACADEKIRSMKAPRDPTYDPSLRHPQHPHDPLEKPPDDPKDNVFGTAYGPVVDWERISAREWRDREVDYDADDGQIDVVINGYDFSHWLDQQPANREATTKPAGKHPRDVVKHAINELWPDEVPKELVNKAVVKLVRDKLAKDCEKKGLPLLPVSDDTILRAAGRK